MLSVSRGLFSVGFGFQGSGCVCVCVYLLWLFGRKISLYNVIFKRRNHRKWYCKQVCTYHLFRTNFIPCHCFISYELKWQVRTQLQPPVRLQQSVVFSFCSGPPSEFYSNSVFYPSNFHWGDPHWWLVLVCIMITKYGALSDSCSCFVWSPHWHTTGIEMKPFSDMSISMKLSLHRGEDLCHTLSFACACL